MGVAWAIKARSLASSSVMAYQKCPSPRVQTDAAQDLALALVNRLYFEMCLLYFRPLSKDRLRDAFSLALQVGS